jgi:hypothetical protein
MRTALAQTHTTYHLVHLVQCRAAFLLACPAGSVCPPVGSARAPRAVPAREQGTPAASPLLPRPARAGRPPFQDAHFSESLPSKTHIFSEILLCDDRQHLSTVLEVGLNTGPADRGKIYLRYPQGDGRQGQGEEEGIYER